MEHAKYSLAKKGKSVCPKCGQRTFVLYIDQATGRPLHSTAGRCDRLDKCSHHYTPKQYFSDNNFTHDNKKEYAPRRVEAPRPMPAPSFINEALFRKSLSHYEQNHFVQWLVGVVGKERAGEAVGRYNIGTTKEGGTVYWQVDIDGRVRAGKIIAYDSNGRRRKDVTPQVQWVHKALKLPDFNLSQCLFGEHLLTDKSKTVAIVEAEKTSTIASIYLPQMIWVACGGSEGLGYDKCAVLRGRNVVLFPDCGQYGKWLNKAKELSKICACSVSSLIEDCATEQERRSGFDIADYLTRFPLSDFSEKRETPNASVIGNQFNLPEQDLPPIEIIPVLTRPVLDDPPRTVLAESSASKLDKWGADIKELEFFF